MSYSAQALRGDQAVWLPPLEISADRVLDGTNWSTLVDATLGLVLVTLPSGAVLRAGLQQAIRKQDGSANVVRVLAAAGHTIEGAASLDLATPGAACLLQWDGTSRWLRVFG